MLGLSGCHSTFYGLYLVYRGNTLASLNVSRVTVLVSRQGRAALQGYLAASNIVC